ncbi:MAG: sigma-70 family RNA polymerase sigma factor [Planctomycetota bacterium]
MAQRMDLTACLSGDKRAWDAFVERYASVLFAAVQRTFRRYMPDHETDLVHDAVQEVFVRLVKSDFRLLRSYDPARSSITTWLTMVARSTAIDHLRKQRPILPLEDERAEALAAAGEESDAPDVEIPEGLLSPRQRLVLRLLFNDDLSVAQAAEVMGVEQQTVRSAKHKAIAKLREFFGSK